MVKRADIYMEKDDNGGRSDAEGEQIKQDRKRSLACFRPVEEVVVVICMQEHGNQGVGNAS